MSLAAEIRRALAAEDFAEAARLYEDLARQTPSHEALEEARGLLALAFAARAQTQRRLDELRSRSYVAGAYGDATPRE